MMMVRDRSRGGKAVSWSTDHERMDEIAATNPAFETVEDRAAYDYYWYVKPEGLAWVHPYDLDAQLHAEIKP